MNKLLKLFTLAVVSIAFFSCEDDPINPTEPTLYDMIEKKPKFAILKKALEKTGLDETLDDKDASLTLFAPDNMAFAKLLDELEVDGLDDIPKEVLTKVLLNHVISGVKKSTDLSTGYVSVLAKESTTSNPISLYVNVEDGVMLNGEAMVVKADKMAKNGVLHQVDDVINLPTVVTFVKADPTFSTLLAAATLEEFEGAIVEALTGEGPLTVFAPTNDAFGSLLEELEVDGLDDVEAATVASILKYHVVAGVNILSSTLTDGAEVETLNGGKFTVKLDGDSAKIKDAKERMANIIAVDVQANNGIVHVLDKVILPAQED